MVSLGDIDRIFLQDQEQQAMEKAILLLSYRKRSRQELKQRLTNEQYTAPVIDNVLDALEDKGYLNDRDFALSFARDKVRNTAAGPRKIALELARHHLSDDMIQSVIDEVFQEFSVTDLIQKLLKKRRYDLQSARDRQKAIRFLQGKGFYTEQIITEMKP